MTSDRPNLLLFMPDQLRADAVGAFGNRVVRTPSIDRLAARAVRFREAYSQHSACSQSRISMFTGRYPHVAGHRTLEHLLGPDEPNVFRRLRDSGYHVAMAGARGDMLGSGVTRASCDRFGFTTRPSLDDIARWHRSPHDESSKWYAAFYGGPTEGEMFEFDAASVATAVDWLNDDMPEPWCLFVALLFPHPPFTVERSWYAGMTASTSVDPSHRRSRGSRRSTERSTSGTGSTVSRPTTGRRSFAPTTRWSPGSTGSSGR
jgi:arylsulfatase A-like enzyme